MFIQQVEKVLEDTTLLKGADYYNHASLWPL